VHLVTGATGNVGSAVVRALAERGARVRAVSRHPRPSGLPGVEAVGGDLGDPATLAGPLEGVTGVFLLAGYDDLPALLQRAREAGVARVVLLSSASVPTGKTDNAVVAYHSHAEEDVRASGLPWTFLRPSMFMTNALEWAGQITAGDVVRARFPHVAAAVIDPEDVGAVAAEALVGGAQEGRALRLTGPESLLPADRVALLGRTLGRELRFVGMSDEESRAEVFDTMPEHYARAFVRFYLDGELDESPVLPTVRDVLGREPRTFARWAADHADAFGARPSR
jgi:uncharacterized protein YbjT (DUF2867 family)